MKKTSILIVFMACVLGLASCGGDEPQIEDKEQEQTSIAGVWVCGDFFVSFSEDGFYAAYLSDEFIDSGSYDFSDGVATCVNSYFNRTTTYRINSLSEAQMSVSVSLINNHGKSETLSLAFTKNGDAPALRDVSLMGKTATMGSSYFGRISYSFITSNSGTKSATDGSAKKYPLDFFYVFINNKLYLQTLKPAMVQVPTIGGWSNDYNKVKSFRLKFSSNGSIRDFTSI